MPYMNQSDNIFILEDRHDLIYAGINVHRAIITMKDNYTLVVENIRACVLLCHHIFSWYKYNKYVYGYLKSVIWRILNASI